MDNYSRPVKLQVRPARIHATGAPPPAPRAGPYSAGLGRSSGSVPVPTDPTRLAPGCGSPHLSLALALPSPGVPSQPPLRPSVDSAA